MIHLSKKLFIVILIAFLHLFFYSSEDIEKFDYKIYDSSVNFFSKNNEDASYSVVIDIDEKSIQAFGQWPWSRVITAELLEEIGELYPSTIGVNILFPEKDRLSPISIQAFYEQYFNLKVEFSKIPSALKDNDRVLLQTLQKLNATLPIYISNEIASARHCNEVSYKNNLFSKVKTHFKGNGLLCNHRSLQEGIKNFGFINAWMDSDGIFRRIPLFMSYKEQIIPSFALATLWSLYEDNEFDESEDTVLVNFSSKLPKVISALDILNGEVSSSDIQGKVVILGSSVIGFNSMFKMPNNKEVSHSMIHAILIDNMLNNSMLTQPKVYKKINLGLSFFFSLVIILFLLKKRYVSTIMLLLTLFLLSSLTLFMGYENGVYISLGYFWIPLALLLFFVMLYHIRLLNKEHQEQENFLIRQSKLASMGEMISLIAHQWRQPLSAINGTVLNIDMDYRQEKLNANKLDDYLNTIEERTVYLSKTISDFTDFFSKNKQVHLFKLSKVIEQAIHLSSSTLYEDVEISYTKENTLEVKGYSSELIQSLLVLINNAIYVCDEASKRTGKKGKIRINVEKQDKQVLISVEDNGGGIDKKNIKKIFDPYFTTKEENSGTGLGLYILKLLVEDSMNGKVLVENTNEGAIFSILLPPPFK